MRLTIAAACAFVLLAGPVFAQDRKDAPKREPSAAQMKQQERMKDCNVKAKGMKGDERGKYMKDCLGGKAQMADKGGKMTPQQNKMAMCNKEAGEKKMKGEERKKFMSSCLKG